MDNSESVPVDDGGSVYNGKNLWKRCVLSQSEREEVADGERSESTKAMYNIINNHLLTVLA